MLARRLLVLCLTLPLLGAAVQAQGTADCATASDCPPSPAVAATDRQLWTEAATVFERKQRFVDAVRRFTREQSGTFGPQPLVVVGGTIPMMQRTLSDWDLAVEQFERVAARSRAVAEAHVALATVYLDRRRIADALRELDAADAAAPDRPDVPAMLAVALPLAGRTADAVRARSRALALSPEDPVRRYDAMQAFAAAGRVADAQRERRSLIRVLTARVAQPDRATQGKLRFERLDLLRQESGVAPLFATYRYQAGYQLLDQGRYGDAVAAFATAAAADPVMQATEPTETLQRGAMLMGLPEVSHAVAVLEPVVQRAADRAEPQRMLGLAYWLIADHNRSIERLRAAARLDPGDDRARVDLGFVLAAAGRPAEAEQTLRQTLQTFPGSAQACDLLARLLESQAMAAAAADTMQRCASAPPIVGRDAFYARLAALEVQRANFDGAIDAYTRRVAANPNGGDGHRQLAEIFFLQGRDEEALAEFLMAAVLAPADARALAGIGQVYVRMQRYAEAVPLLRRALDGDGVEPPARYALATALLRTGNEPAGRREMEIYQQARAALDAAGQQAFEREARRREALRLLAAGMPSEAITTLEELAGADPGNARAQRELGLALLRAGRVQEAIAALEGAKVRDHENPEAYRYLADAYAAIGSAEDARKSRGAFQILDEEMRRRDLRDLAIR